MLGIKAVVDMSKGTCTKHALDLQAKRRQLTHLNNFIKLNSSIARTTIEILNINPSNKQPIIAWPHFSKYFIILLPTTMTSQPSSLYDFYSICSTFPKSPPFYLAFWLVTSGHPTPRHSFMPFYSEIPACPMVPYCFFDYCYCPNPSYGLFESYRKDCLA